MTAENGPAIFRKRRAGQGEITVQRLEQGLADLADIAGGRRVEGGAVLEENLLAPLCAQPFKGGQGVGYRLRRRDSTRLQRNHDRIGIQRRSDFIAGDTDALHSTHAAAHQHIGQVCGPGEVVGDAAQQRACAR